MFQAFKQEGEDEAAAAEDKAKREAKEAEKLAARTKKISLSEDTEKVSANQLLPQSATQTEKGVQTVFSQKAVLRTARSSSGCA